MIVKVSAAASPKLTASFAVKAPDRVAAAIVAVPVTVGAAIVLFDKVSAPARLASVPVVGKVTFVDAVAVKVVSPPVTTKLFAPRLIVPVLLTPVPPRAAAKVPELILSALRFVIAEPSPLKASPSKVTAFLEPPIVINKSVPSNSTAPFSGVVKFVPAFNFNGAVPAVAVPATICNLALGAASPRPMPSTLASKLNKLASLSPSILKSTSAPESLATTAPVIVGASIVAELIVLLVKVSVPASVETVPDVGKVKLVIPEVVNEILLAP